MNGLIQGVPGGKDNILGGHSIGHSKQKTLFEHVSYSERFRDRDILVVWLGRPVLSFPPALLREGGSIFWEVMVSVILSKKLYMNMCPIPNGFRVSALCLGAEPRRGGEMANTGTPSQTTIRSNGCISETVRNRTHVHIKFFA
jgi:hypothetical protein